MISLTTVIIIAAVCVLIEAFFSGSEIALVSASRAKLRSKVRAGKRGASLAERYLDAPQILLATTLLGTNMATVTFSVTVTIFLVQGDYGGGELLAVLLVTPVTLIGGEVIPKTYFQQRADELVTSLIYPLHFASLVLRPFVLILSAFAKLMSKLVGADTQRAFVTRQELSLLLEANEGQASTEITDAERSMITNILEMSDETVGRVMLPLSETTALPEDTTVADAIREVADKQHSRMPVYEDRLDNVVGVLHVFDLLQVKPGERDQAIKDIARPVRYVPETLLAVDLLVELQGTGNQMAIVVDEYGGAVGVVTTEDLLEEIVGEIEDEHDDVSSLIVAERAGVWSIQAKVSVERLNQELDLCLPEDDEYESLAGLILHRLRRIPRQGESVIIEDITLRVTRVTSRAIDQVQLLRSRKR